MWIYVEPEKVYAKQLFSDKYKELVTASITFVQKVRQRRHLLPGMILELNGHSLNSTDSDGILNIETGELEGLLSLVLWDLFSSLSTICQ